MAGFSRRLSRVASANGELPRRAAEFIDSMGICAHLSATDYQSTATVTNAMSYIGLIHIRTNSAINDTTYALPTTNALIANGVRVHFTTPQPAGTGSGPSLAQIQSAIDSRINYITANNLTVATDSIEPFNEYDGSGEPSWASVLQNAQPYMSSQAATNLSGVKVLGPALIGNNLLVTASQIQLASTGQPLKNYFDYGNLHSYFGGRQPESSYADATSNFAPSVAPSDDTVFDNRLGLYAYYVSPDKPIIVTEMGYHNYASSTYTSLQATGIYAPRAFLETFRIGITRAYAYELLDEPSVAPGQEQHFGFFDSAANPKPSAVSLHNLTSLVTDNGSTRFTFPLTRLPYTISGSPSALLDLRKVLLQKSNGVYWLALWQGVSVFDYVAGTDIAPLPPSQTINLVFQHTVDVTFFQDTAVDTVGAGAAMGSGTSFAVSVGPKVSLVRIAVA